MEDLMQMLLGGEDFQKMEDTLQMVTQHVCSALPEPPVAAAAPLYHAGLELSPDGVDRISALPASLLRNIVSRLPVKDAARTTVLSRVWSRVWRSVPLVLIDAHLLPCGDLTVPVSRALAAHPGPFRGIYLTGTPLDAHRAEVARWLRLFAAKGVEELTLFNRAQTMAANPPLPDTLFNCSSLTRLYLGFWRFPDTAALPDTHTACFPYLLELGLCALLMEQRDIAFLIEKCPVLEKLVIVGSRHPVYLRIESRSLICVQVCSAVVPEIVISDAVSLKRLLLWEAWGPGCLANMRCRIKIGHSPNLQSLGFLVPGMHELQIGDTLIEVGGEATVPSLQILAVQVRLGASREAKKLPVLLRCFPNIDTLIVQCEKNVKDHFRGASPKLHPPCSAGWSWRLELECCERKTLFGRLELEAGAGGT